MAIERGQTYRLNPSNAESSQYFKDKYGFEHPVIRIEGKDTDLWGGRNWEDAADEGNMAAILFERRLKVPPGPNDAVYGGQIQDKDGQRHSELVLERELQAL